MRPCCEAAGAFGRDPSPELPPEFPLHALISSAGIAAQAKIARVFLMWIFLHEEVGALRGLRSGALAPLTGPALACPETDVMTSATGASSWVAEPAMRRVGLVGPFGALAEYSAMASLN